MAIKNSLDPAALTERLEGWLPAVLGVDSPVRVSGVQIPTESGMSSETVLFEATWSAGGSDQTRGLVLRVPPDISMFPESAIDREAKLMSALAEHCDAPVPRVIAHEPADGILGTEFLLVERSYGRVPADDPPFVATGWVTDLGPEQRATMYDNALRAIAAIQTVDPNVAGLEHLRRGDPGRSVIEQEFTYWRRFYEWAAGDRRSPLIDEALTVLEKIRPPDGDLVVSWGDARFGNLMFGDDLGITAVLDWELAALGRPEVDLGYFLFFDRLYSDGIGFPRLDGFPDRKATVTRFEELTAHPVEDLEWFEAWAALRTSILMVRLGHRMIEHGQIPRDATMPFNNPPSQALAALLQLPPPDGDAEWFAGKRG